MIKRLKIPVLQLCQWSLHPFPPSISGTETCIRSAAFMLYKLRLHWSTTLPFENFYISLQFYGWPWFKGTFIETFLDHFVVDIRVLDWKDPLLPWTENSHEVLYFFHDYLPKGKVSFCESWFKTISGLICETWLFNTFRNVVKMLGHKNYWLGLEVEDYFITTESATLKCFIKARPYCTKKKTVQ